MLCVPQPLKRPNENDKIRILVVPEDDMERSKENKGTMNGKKRGVEDRLYKVREEFEEMKPRI
jgi:hypothetical protein